MPTRVLEMLLTEPRVPNVLVFAVGQVHRAGPRVDAEVRDVIHPVRKSINNKQHEKTEKTSA